MVKPAYEWFGPFKYQTNGEAFEYKGKHYWTKAGYQRWIVQSAAYDRIYENDELYARLIRRTTGAPIFDELPEGWHRGIHEYGGRRGLRGRYDCESAYEWCETDVPMYRNAYPGDWRRNPDYRQGLVRRA